MSSVCSLTLTDEQIDALIVEVWRMSRDDEVIFDLRCDQFMNAMNTWWDTPTLRVG